jgi:hypothetical protein
VHHLWGRCLKTCCFLVRVWCCRNFDKDHIEPKTLKKLQTYTSQPEMQPENVKKVQPISPSPAQLPAVLRLPVRACQARDSPHTHRSHPLLHCCLCLVCLQSFAAAYGLCCWVHAMEMFGRAAAPSC